MKWSLRLAAANRGIWKAGELQRLLAERGIVEEQNLAATFAPAYPEHRSRRRPAAPVPLPESDTVLGAPRPCAGARSFSTAGRAWAYGR